MAGQQPQIIARFYKIRIYQPGFGPRIISAFMSDLQAGDLSNQVIFFPCPGGTANLPAGFTNYIVGDCFFDPVAGQIWGCTQAGSNQVGQTGGSVWQAVSGGGGGFMGVYAPGTAYAKGSSVVVLNTTTLPGAPGQGQVIVLAGRYSAAVAIPAAIPNNNYIPQFPEPSQNPCWYLDSFRPNAMNQNCGTGLTGYLNATNPITINAN